MKKLLIACLLGFSALTAAAQDEGLNDVRVVANDEFNSGEPVIAQGYYVSSDPDSPEAIDYTWMLTPCDQDGNPVGDPVFTQRFNGAPMGEDFVFPGSEGLASDQYYRIDMGVTNAVGVYTTGSKITLVVSTSAGCVSGATSFSVEPGSGIAGTGQSISLTTGNYFFQLSTSGTPNLVSNFLTIFNGINRTQNSVFTITPNTPFDLSFNIPAGKPLCVSQTFTLTFFNILSQQVCTYSVTINSKSKSKQTIVNLNSGVYYKGDDNHLHRFQWNGSSWNYQAIVPWGGWGSIEIDGWLTGDPNVDRVFFKGKDGGLYNIFFSNGSWLLGIVGNGLFDVKSDVHMAGQQLYYIANDNLVHRRFFANNQWNAALISPQNSYQGVTAVGGLAASPSGGVWFRASNNNIMQLFMSGNTYFSQFMPTNISCGGDMIWDDGQSILYYRGTDNNIHNVSWDWINGWVFNAMTSQNGNVFVTNNLTHTAGENRVWFKGTDGRVYGIWKQSNGQWRIDWASGAANNAAGDLVAVGGNIFFNTTAKQMSNYWFSGNPSWNINILNGSAPSNAIGCSTLYRLGAQNEGQGTDGPAAPGADEALFDVLPNPNNGTFMVKLPAYSEDNQVELVNSIGARVDAFTFSGTEYNYAPSQDLAAGIYLLRMTSGGVTTSKRFVVK
jgi:hypothetical protein